MTNSEFCVFYVDDKESHVSMQPVQKDNSCISWKKFAEPVRVWTEFFNREFGSASAIELQYHFPGKHSWYFLTDEEYTELHSVMELYHKMIGKVHLANASNDAEILAAINDIKYRFLKGNPITPEALYLHDEENRHMYVVRKEMKEFKFMVQDELKLRSQLSEENRSRKGIFLLEHEASGGGTTCGKYMLYTLRNEYPCIDIKMLDLRLLEGLKRLHLKSCKPLLMVIDNSELQTSEIIDLQRSLEKKNIKGLIVHIKRKTSTSRQRQRSGENSGECVERVIDKHYELTSHVGNGTDKLSFKELYETSEQRPVAQKLKVFMFGLCKFMAEYEKLNAVIRNCISVSTPKQLEFIRVSLMIWKYTHHGLQLAVVRKMLSMSYEEDIESALGCTADFLVYDKDNTQLRLANDCIIEPFLAMLDNSNQKQQMDMFIQSIKQFSVNDSSTYKEDSFELIAQLFIRNRKHDQFWTEFIEDLERINGREFVAETTSLFLKMLDGVAPKCPHLRTFYARYLMNQMEDPQKAIQQIRIALGVSETSCIGETAVTDVVLFAAYGDLHKRVMEQKIGQVALFSEGNGPNPAIAEKNSLTAEAVTAYTRAQGIKKTIHYALRNLYSANVFYKEAVVRYKLLTFTLTHICSGDQKKFNAYIVADDTDPLICESLPRALDVLQRLEYLESLALVDCDAEVGQNVTRTKFDLLKLTTDHTLNIKRRLEGISDKIPCDFAYFLLNPAPESKIEWRDLSIASLKFIIKRIYPRFHLPKIMLRSNYRDIIRALIYIRRQCTDDDMPMYSLKMAHECAQEWVRHHNNDYEAHFILWVLKLIQGIQDEDLSVIKDAQKHFGHCNKVCKEQPYTPHYYQNLYWVGNGNGLQVAIPFEKSISKPKLRKFVGRLLGNHVIAVQCGGSTNAFQAKIDKNGRNTAVSITGEQQQRLVKFNIALAIGKVSAVNVTNYEKEATDSDEAAADCSIVNTGSI